MVYAGLKRFYQNLLIIILRIRPVNQRYFRIAMWLTPSFNKFTHWNFPCLNEQSDVQNLAPLEDVYKKWFTIVLTKKWQSIEGTTVIIKTWLLEVI